jgi:hypothetical protein
MMNMVEQEIIQITEEAYIYAFPISEEAKNGDRRQN